MAKNCWDEIALRRATSSRYLKPFPTCDSISPCVCCLRYFAAALCQFHYLWLWMWKKALTINACDPVTTCVHLSFHRLLDRVLQPLSWWHSVIAFGSVHQQSTVAVHRACHIRLQVDCHPACTCGSIQTLDRGDNCFHHLEYTP
jgi:hypothetical protein